MSKERNQNATDTLRVATKHTTKMRMARTQVVWKNFSCSFVTSMARKRPPKFKRIIVTPIKYGFVLKAASVVSIGFSGPVIIGAIKGGAVVRLISAIGGALN